VARGSANVGRVRDAARFLLLLVWIACLPAGAEEPAAPSDAREAVVLLHGLYRSHLSMRPLETRLEAAGYAVHNLRYPSTAAAPDALAAELREQIDACCADAPRLHFVTHSLGGILARALLAQRAPANLGRVVMLAPPNHGSEWVDVFGGAFGWALGPTGRELGTAPSSLPNRLPPPSFPLGVIAGNFSWNPLGSLLLPGESDGTVSVESTQLDGMSDFVAVPSSHTFILRSDAAAEHVLEFLRAGRFEDSGT
jgi:pimeloyl-ACP methyl ester carboxylesterase